MKAVFIGAVEASAALLRAAVATELRIAAVITLAPEDGRRRHSDYVDLEPVARGLGVPCRRINPEEDIAAIVHEHNPDVVLVWGWSRLVPETAYAAARLGGVGFHPAPLPIGRGRHPLIWSIILGLEQSAVSFFRLSDEADAGDILVQRPFAIGRDDDAGAVMRKATKAACDAVPDLVSHLAHHGASGRPQDGRAAISWRKRSAADGRVDFRMSTAAIDRLVRALTRPYPGADAVHADLGTGKIWKVSAAARDTNSRYAEPGRVIGGSPAMPVIACEGGAVSLVEHDFAAPIERGTWFC